MGGLDWAYDLSGVPAHRIALIDDWSGAPSPSGAAVKAALLGYDDPPAAGASP